MLNDIYNQCKICKKCDLAKTRGNIVFGQGVATAPVMLIGEAPGKNEDEQGLPFVGRSGKLLDSLLESVGLSREKNVYICNTVKCRPPENRDPSAGERVACAPYLQAQIDAISPKLILLCGKVALSHFLPHEKSMKNIRGKWFLGPNNILMMPIYHPAYLLRNPVLKPGSPKEAMMQDLTHFKEKLDAMKG